MQEIKDKLRETISLKNQYVLKAGDKASDRKLEEFDMEIEALNWMLDQRYTSIYIAGSLFTEADQAQRMMEERDIRKIIDHLGLSTEVFNPINNPFNDKSTKPTALDITLGDTQQIADSTHVLLNLDNQLDAGVFVELGQILGLPFDRRDIRVYPVISDIRMTGAGEYNAEEVPWGINTYVIGALQFIMGDDYKMYTSSSEAIVAMMKDIEEVEARGK